ncbi:hypothetical protein E2C01_043583 [Portunus trituberculatus]|uniref:Uncharacterized protein n=1 Tax=Portunus trituberculatus TaxID=210409 RepID=A0A5B7FX33_PORTR|nr:hypothetical protein [Portunus trituberculatus]
MLATGQPPVAQQQLCGITGPCTQLRGPVYARIEVGSTEERLLVYVADVGENLLGLDYLQRSRAMLDFGKMTMAVGGNVVPLQESGGDAVEREVSIENHQAHTAPSPEASHCCRLGEEQEEESLRSGGCEGVQMTMDPEGHSEDTQESSTGEEDEDPDLNPGQPEPRVLEEDEVEELCPLDGTLADVDAEPVVGRLRRERRLLRTGAKNRIFPPGNRGQRCPWAMKSVIGCQGHVMPGGDADWTGDQLRGEGKLERAWETGAGHSVYCVLQAELDRGFKSPLRRDTRTRSGESQEATLPATQNSRCSLAGKIAK